MDRGYKTLKEIAAEQPDPSYMLKCFGDMLTEREGYQTVSGLDAVHLFLVNKHHWKPSEVNALSPEEIRFTLSEELDAWLKEED